MSKAKKINIPIFELNLPDEYKPEWYKLGIEPYEAKSELEEGEIMLKKPQTVEYKRGVPPISDNTLNIKEAEVMGDPNEFAWFNSEDQPENIEDVIDNNETIDIENIQRIKVPKETFDSVHSIRDKLLKRKTKNRVADIGDFVVLHKGNSIYVGDEGGVRKVCEKIILENENLKDDDLVVFYRVSLQKFFR